MGTVPDAAAPYRFLLLSKKVPGSLLRRVTAARDRPRYALAGCPALSRARSATATDTETDASPPARRRPRRTTFSVTPLSAQTTPDVIGGRMRGTWDLPASGQPGTPAASSSTSARSSSASMRASRRSPISARGAGSNRRVLLRKTATGFEPNPVAEVHGTSTWSDWTERAASRPRSSRRPLPGLSPEPMGMMDGVFADPMVGDTDPVGRFAGRWVLRI